MCLDSLMGGSSKSQRNMQIWQAQMDEIRYQQQKEEQARQYAENERQRIAAQELQERRYQEQIAREAAIIEDQKKTAADASAEAKAAEAARVAQIQGNRGQIEQAFAGFNDAYYADAAKRYADAYLPSLEDDRVKSMDKLTAALAGKGMLESTVGINAFADLEKRAAQERASTAARGQDFAESLRAKVGAAKSNLFDAAASGGDPQQWLARATGEATNILDFGGVVPAGPTASYGASYYSPQGGTTTTAAPQNASIFGAVLAPLVNATNSALNAPKISKAQTIAPAATTGSGTAKVVQ